jgi:glycine cleavage system aminomethyltransferase T
MAELEHSPLEPLLLRAGATMSAHHGWLMAAHFGSPPGEMAACERSVGLADRSDLGKFELRGPRDDLDVLIGQLSGGEIRPGDALHAAGVWWCSVSREHALAVCDPEQTDRLSTAIGEAMRWVPGATVTDATRSLAALGLFGPRTRELLEELRSSEPPFAEDATPELQVTRLASVPVMVLRTTPEQAVILTHRSRAPELWDDAERAGDPLGITRVGAQAVNRLPLARGSG